LSEHEQRVADELRPQTVEQAADLEESLTAALEDVRTRKAELEQRADPA